MHPNTMVEEHRCPGRWEDAAIEVAKRFNQRDQFYKFAIATEGLCLHANAVRTIQEDTKHSIEEFKFAVLEKWKQHNDENPTCVKDIAERYLKSNCQQSESEDGPGERKKCPLTKILHSLCTVEYTRKQVLAGLFITISSMVVGIYLLFQSGTSHNHYSGNGCQDYQKNVYTFKSKVNGASRIAANDLHFKELKQPEYDTFPETVLVNFYNTPMLQRGYTPEVAFTQQASKIAGETIRMSEFFKSNEMQKMNYVALVGGVGYGKTEMLKRISRDVLSHSYSVLNSIEIVRLIYLRELENEKEMSVGDLLFGGIPELTDDEIICGVDYISQNQEKVLFVLDGLDQYPEELGQGKPMQIRSVQKPSKTLSSLIAGKLFPDIKILLSSREHAIRHFEGTMRPDRVIALSGFSLTSIEKLVKSFGGMDDGGKIWSHLQTRSPTLLSVSSIPMFLVFTVMVLKCEKEEPPKTSTEVLMHVLHYLETSKHSTKDIISVIPKLKLMSFKGTRAGEVSFSKKDLPNDLTIDEVADVLITFAGVEYRNQRLVDGHFRLSFCHQSLQEALAALHVAEMPLEEFQTFVSSEIHRPQWVIVRRMVCGLLLNQKTLKIAQGNDPSVSLLNTSKGFDFSLSKKKKVLLDSLQNQLSHLQGDGKMKSALLELMHSLHESGELAKGIIADSTDEINLLNMPLTKTDIHVLFSAISHCPNLTLLSLINCGLGDDDLLLLAETFKKSKTPIKVRILLLGNYEQVLSLKSATAIRDMLKYVTDFAWLGYKINDTIAQMFKKEMEQAGRPERIYSWRHATRTRMLILETNTGVRKVV